MITMCVIGHEPGTQDPAPLLDTPALYEPVEEAVTAAITSPHTPVTVKARAVNAAREVLKLYSRFRVRFALTRSIRPRALKSTSG